MRAFGVLAILGLSVVASAQLGAIKAIEGSVRELQKAGKIGLPMQKNPLSPAGFPTERQGTLPTPEDREREFKLIKSGRARRIGDTVTLEGPSEFEFEGYRVICGGATGNLQTKRFVLTGGATVTGEDAVVIADRIDVDFDARSFVAFDGTSELRPNLVRGLAQDTLFLRATEVGGSQREVRGRECEFTSCSLKSPHFHLDSASAVVRPGRRVILRKAELHILGRHLLTIPYLSIPLDERFYNSLPEIGQSPDEGFYIKNRYSIPVRGDNAATALVDLMSRIGTGLGLDTAYRSRRLDGRTRAYGITGTIRTFTLNNELRQILPFGSLSMQNDFQQDNYLSAPGSVSFGNRVQLQINGSRGASTRVGFFQQGSRSDSFKTDSANLSLADQRRLGNLATDLNVNVLTNTSSFGSSAQSRRTADVRFRGTQELSFATAALEYQRQIPIGSTQSFLGSSDRTPVFSLAADSRRLLGAKRGEAFPFRAEFSLGEYFDSLTQSPIGRGNLDLSFQRPNRSKSRFGVDISGQFRQGIYSDDTAQYVLGLNTSLSYKLGRDTGANLRYSYLRPYGYSPLSLDRGGRTHYISADLSFRPAPKVLVGAQTGFDILRLERQEIGWQQVGLRTEWRPNDKALVRGLATYDTFRTLWSSVRLDATTMIGETYFSLGSRFDGQRHTWSNANLILENLRYGRLKASALLSYNGFLKKFESRQVAFTYDLHCTEAILQISEVNTGFRPGRTVSFFLRVKAFPFETPFGSGSRGQPLGTGTGRDF